MFPKGPRFDPLKVPDVPGPNAYNIPPESSLESYKRGAFLEKTDRFSKEKPPHVPVPASKPVSNKIPSTKPSQNQVTAERYNILQRKVDDLEKVHLEGKKAHQVELERVKQDAAASQKLAADNAERFEKQKKNNALLEVRIQELKKISTSDQSEMKDLRHKLRVLELEREKNSAKQPEINELKKTLATVEAKRKEELKERDRRISELEKHLQIEKKKHEALESRAQDFERGLHEEAQSKQMAIQQLEARVLEAEEESRVAKKMFHQIEHETSNREEELVERLEQYRTLLNTVAEQYGALASHSVSLAAHDRLQRDYVLLQLRQLRIERKLANSEGQVVELAHLIRHLKEQNTCLQHQLSTTINDYYTLTHFDTSASPNSDDGFEDGFSLVLSDILQQQKELAITDTVTNSLTSTYYHLKSDELVFASSVLDKEVITLQGLADQRGSDLSSALASHETIATRLESLHKEKSTCEDKLKIATTTANDLRASTAILEAQLSEAHEELANHDIVLKKEKDTIQRLTSTIQKNRVAEDVLRAEIDELTADLTNAERYQEAYYSLSDEVASLLTRNQIAEEEADRISKFNAKILGHNNPAQRIMYVDRIRRELADAKYKIAQLGREQETAWAQNNDLQNELDMYKSVRVPLDCKPKTNLTRIGRPPLVNLTQSLNLSTHNAPLGKLKPSFLLNDTPLDVINDSDMTTDEFI
ncbi:hypothetical protein M413DRAFT_24307 [Hebeloma cylindrosporum]|uniref:Hyaluronan-mediated motility receptor C-terminal domain-containing protein n=1 Tax=Hebeloma cylindrosporum TaxID=76867 RepID=A0A0C3C877_HEBCY|nr:hypothetical protein M413DRAFT_24307 [Hebeloma cylindrosporum h7]